MNKKFLYVVLILLVLPLVSSLDNVVKKDDPYDIRVTLLANGTINTVTANITINDPDGVVIVSFAVMQKNLASQDFNYTLPGSNTSKLGVYDCTAYAFSNIADNDGFPCSFEVNPSGKDYIPQISGPLLFGAIITLMFMSLFLLLVSSKIDLFPMKVFLIILAGIIAIMNIGFVAGSFQEFLSAESSLSSSFGTLYVMFIILMAGSSIFLMVWVIVVSFKLYQVKRGFFIQE